MTIEQCFIRFLKENKLYAHRKRIIYEHIIFKKQMGFPIDYEDYKFTGVFYRFDGCPKNLFANIFKCDSFFCGNSKSPQRKKYYLLNRKWKDFLKNKVVIQHNIKEGDKIIYRNIFGYHKMVQVTKTPLNDNSAKIYGADKNGDTFATSLFSIIDVNRKEPVINIYIKNKDGNCYGKLEGEYNEIQLQ